MAARAGTTDVAKAGASPLPAFLLLYATLYSAYGTISAYLPSFLMGHGLPAERLGAVLAAGTLVRITAGPVAGRLADASGRRRAVLAVTAVLSAAAGLAYLAAFGLGPLLAVMLLQSAATAPLAPLADALAIAAAAGPAGFQYGWVRGAGSAAFVVGTLVSGQLVDRLGLSAIVVASSTLFAALALATARVPAPPPPGAGDRDPVYGRGGGAFATLFALPAYRRLLAVAALVIGSHALNDAFAVITWRAAGYDGTTVSLLWSESVLAEVVVFFLVGPPLLRRLGPAGALALSAAAGVIRWGTMGVSAALPALAAVQGLHGFTFALLHLAAMRIIAVAVPDRLFATAQSVYGNVALGIASAALTLASGYLYAGFGREAFFAMAGLCLLALPLTAALRRVDEAIPPR